ncbi:MAG: hypothetical protein JWQ43_918 [Glaciihabitans sp.]|nr:hypothetical protein [Glaciihabitans sp.]
MLCAWFCRASSGNPGGLKISGFGSTAEGNPGDDFTRRVARLYSGSHDVVDALYWRTEPTMTGPTGAPSPQVEWRELQRQVYGRDIDEAERQEATRRLPEVERSLCENIAAIESAVAAARESAPESKQRPLLQSIPESDPMDNDETRTIEYADKPVTGETASAAASAAAAPIASTSRFWNRRVIAAVLVGVVVLVFAGGWGLGRLSTQKAVELTTNTSGGGVAFTVFDRLQEPEDIPGLIMGGGYLPETFRQLFDHNDFAVYAVRTIDTRVCVVGVLELHEAAASCTAVDAFDEFGLSLDVLTGEGQNAFLNEVRWRPDGSASFSQDTPFLTEGG